MPRRSLLVTAAAAVLILTACAESPSTNRSDAVPAVTPAVPAHAVSVAPGEQPPLAFAGACDNMVTDAEIDALVGADVPPLPTDTGGAISSVDVLGGLMCAWGGLDYAFSVVLTVIPAGDLEDRIDAEYSYPGGLQCWGQDKTGAGGACYFGRIVEGYWLAGLFTVEDGIGLLPAESIDALAALVEERASEYPAAPVRLPDGTWQPLDCGALADRVAEQLSTDGPGAVSGATSGGYLGPGPVGAESIIGFARCIWSDPSGFTTDLTPGGGWAMARLTEAETIEVDGASAAVLQEQVEGASRITATDGVNLASITVPESSTPADAAAFLGAVLRAAGE